MKINNGFNILPWYDSLEKQHQKKWYAYGQSWPLLCPQGTILPFQFISDTAISISSNIYAINTETGSSFDLGVKPVVTEITHAESTYYIVKLTSSASKNIPVGKYSLRMATSEGYLYSEEITIIDNTIDCIKVEYWNEDTLRFTAGEINFEDNFRFIFYINSTIGKPEYEFEEELTKRLGYKFIESQTSNKIYKFSFVAPEYICDAMRLIRMCDFIKLTTKYDSYNALSLSYEPKWQEQGDLASVDVEFETDCIIQKLESFNRRIKESFYNALLSDIEEPILFSSDTVAQYYTEYTSVSYINGKLIRQLEAISEREIEEEIENLVLPIDNQANEEDSKAKKIFLHDILKRSNSGFDKLFKGHYDESGKLLWIEALAHVGINGGVTMFIDNSSLDLPSIYDGLPIDNQTLYWEETTNEDGSVTRILKAKGGSGEGNGTISNVSVTGNGNAITEVSLSSDKKSLNFVKGLTFVDKTFLLENYFTRDEASGLFVTLDVKEQEIIGVKTFLNGLKIGSSKIWQSQDDVVYIDANLVVRGGVTMYAQNNVDIPSFMESLLLDENTLKLDENGRLTVIGGAGGSIEHALTWSGFSSGSYDGKSAKNIYIPSKVSELTNDSLFATQSWVNGKGYAYASDLKGYLPLSGGTLTGDLYMGGTTLYVNTIRGNGSGTKYAIFGGGSTGNIAFGGYYAGCTTSLNGETVAINAADVNKIRVSSSGITVYQDGWSNGLMLNRTVSGGGSSIAVYSNGTHLGQFGINGNNQFELGFASTGTRFTIDSTGECLAKSASADGLTIDRTASNGGAFTRYRPNNQTRYSWAVGASSGYAFSVWYQDTSQNIDTQKLSLDSGGNLLVTGGITMYSDERKKTILRHVELSLKEVADAPLIEHYYNSDDKKTTHVGSIAQYWAGLNDWFCKKDGDGYYTMEIQNVALASAISVARELSRFESDTDRRIRLLEEENKRLKEEIEQLKTA